MNIESVIGKKVALILWNAEQEDDVRVCIGELKLVNTQCFFVNIELGWEVFLNDEQLNRLTLVDEDFKEMLLHADYSITLTVGDMPDDDREYNPTGINWDNDTSD